MLESVEFSKALTFWTNKIVHERKVLFNLERKKNNKIIARTSDELLVQIMKKRRRRRVLLAESERNNNLSMSISIRMKEKKEQMFNSNFGSLCLSLNNQKNEWREASIKWTTKIPGVCERVATMCIAKKSQWFRIK